MSRTRLWLALGGAVVLSGAHAYAVTLPWDLASPWVMASHTFTVVLLAGLLWLGAALGVRVIRILGLDDALRLEGLLFSIVLGLGGVAYLVLACGFLGLLRPWVLAVLLAGLVVALRSELAELLAAAPTLGRAWLAQRRELCCDQMTRLSVLLAEFVVLTLAVRALAPPTGYDALMYHLEGPRQFLQLGRLAPLVEPHQANMPLTVDMLYLIGLAFGSDELASVLHLSLTVLLALATFSFGRRFFSPRIGWLAAAIVLSAPTVAFYAPIANIDFGWALFDFMAVYAFALWTRDRRTHWLIMAGLAAGLSLGSKYLGIVTCAVVALGIVAESLRGGFRLSRVAMLLGQYLVPAALVAAPWYIKNWLWFGSPITPVWPLLSFTQMAEIDAYLLRNMKEQRTWIDYATLPLRFFQNDPENPAARLPYIFALALLYLLVRKHHMVSYLLGLTVIHLALWLELPSTHSYRFLTPTFPTLSLAVAYVLDRGLAKPPLRRIGSIMSSALVIISLLLVMARIALLFAFEHPIPQLVGLESRESYLERVIPDYGAVLYVNEHRPEVDRLLIIGDARLFYLDVPVLVDQGLGLASELRLTGESRNAADQLQRAGVSHILIGFSHLWHMAKFDPEGRVLQWMRDFELVRPGYLSTEYTKPDRARVYRVAPTGVVEAHP